MTIRIWCLLLAAALLGTACPAAAGADVDANAILRELADRLLSEAERQHMVNSRMGAAVKGLDVLLKDLESNDLVIQGKGPVIKRFVKVLAILNVRHVPNAAKYLAEARKRLEALRPNLQAADAEIQIILELLSKLLDRAKSEGQADDLLTQLRIIIRNQEKATGKTRAWGKVVFKKPADAEPAREELKTTQDQIAASVRQFEGNLSDAHQKAKMDPLREDKLGKALRAMKQMKIDKTLDAAAGDIGRTKPVPAVQKQEAALDDLREIEKLLLSDPLPHQIQKMKTAREEIQSILEKQRELTAKTENTPDEKFSEKSKDLQVEQRNIEKQVEKAAESIPDAAEPVKKPLQDAEKHMENAETAMEQTQQPQAVENQKEAEKSLEEAVSQLNQQIDSAESQLAQQQKRQEAANRLQQAAQQVQSLLKRQQQLAKSTEQTQPQDLENLSKPQADLGEEAKEASEQTAEAGEPLQEASEEMAEASESMEQGEKQEAQQHQASAIEALQEAAQAVQQAMQAQEQTPTTIADAATDDPDEEGDRDFGKEKPAGRVPGGDKAHWDHLNPKDRDALKQNFARGLPQEYRELLEDYYEALSKTK